MTAPLSTQFEGHPHLLEKGKSGYTNIPPAKVAMVSTRMLTSLPGNNIRSQEVVDRIAEDLRSGEGLHDPVMISQNPETRQAILGEGNHRLQAAIQAQVGYLPAVMVRDKYLSRGRVLPSAPPYWNDFDDPREALPGWAVQ
jgi:hypothetical protein